VARLSDPRHIDQVLTHMERGMSDDVASWHLDVSGEWVRHAVADNGDRLVDIQKETMSAITARHKASTSRSGTSG
jgi:polyphosphate kinase